jgi:hypothetical protein
MSVVPFLAKSRSTGLNQWLGLNISFGSIAIICTLYLLHESLLRSDTGPQISLAMIIAIIIPASVIFRERAMYEFQTFRFDISAKIAERSLHAEQNQVET